MTITLITPPGQGGVRDFADKLVENTASNQAATVFTWQQDTDHALVEQALFSDCVFLQYSGYGYAKRGAPLWLLNQLQIHRPQIKSLGVFFHELYAVGPPWGSAFWLSLTQRYIAQRLAERCDFWMTSSEANAEWLCRFANHKPHAVLPVFSNVGEMPVYFDQRTPKVIVFGGQALRIKTYQAAGDRLFAWAKRQGLEIHDIGPSISDPILANRLIVEGVNIHGRLTDEEISHLLGEAMFGLVVYQIKNVAKSGVFAAYCAHGICPILISDEYLASDGLIADQNYLADIPDNICNTNLAKEIGLSAWKWYQPHCLAKHVLTLNNLLAEVCHAK